MSLLGPQKWQNRLRPFKTLVSILLTAIFFLYTFFILPVMRVACFEVVTFKTE